MEFKQTFKELKTQNKSSCTNISEFIFWKKADPKRPDPKQNSKQRM